MTDERQFRGVAVRIDRELELRLDRLALALSSPEKREKRAKAARAALLRGLESFERELGIPAT
jgi:hypothetical protein